MPAPMTCTVTCPQCDARLRIKTEYVGRRIPCKNCETRFIAAEETETDAAGGDAFDDEFGNLDDMEFEETALMPRPKKKKKRANGKPAKQAGRTNDGAGANRKLLFGGVGGAIVVTAGIVWGIIAMSGSPSDESGESNNIARNAKTEPSDSSSTIMPGKSTPPKVAVRSKSNDSKSNSRKTSGRTVAKTKTEDRKVVSKLIPRKPAKAPVFDLDRSFQLEPKSAPADYQMFVIPAVARTGVAGRIARQWRFPFAALNNAGDVLENLPGFNSRQTAHIRKARSRVTIGKQASGGFNQSRPPANTMATALNGKGHAVGEFKTSVTGTARAFIFNGDLIDIGARTERKTSSALDINDGGAVVGWASNGKTPQERQAFLFESGRLSFIKQLPNFSGSEARAINNQGQVVGVAYRPGSRATRAFLFERGEVRDLGRIAPAARAAANDINDRGEIVGTTGLKAFLYCDGKMTPLVALQGDRWCEAWSINNHGVAVGNSAKTFGQRRAVMYRDGRTIEIHPRNWLSSEAIAINDHGWILGVGTSGARKWQGFLLLPKGTRLKRNEPVIAGKTKTHPPKSPTYGKSRPGRGRPPRKGRPNRKKAARRFLGSIAFISPTSKPITPHVAITRQMSGLLKYEKTPLDKILTEFAKANRIQVVIHKYALQNQGLWSKMPLTVSLARGKIADGLSAIVAAMKGDVEWRIDNGVFVIDGLAVRQHMTSRVYQVLKGDIGTIHDNIILLKTPSKSVWDETSGRGGTICAVQKRFLVVRNKLPVLLEIEPAFKSQLKRILGPIESHAFQLSGFRLPSTLFSKTLSYETSAQPFKQVLSDLGKKSGLTIVIDGAALKKEGLEDTIAVSCRVQSLSPAHILSLIVEQLQLKWIPKKDGTILVTTQAVAKKTQLTAIHRVDIPIKQELINVVLATNPRSWLEAGGSGVVQRSGKNTFRIQHTFDMHLQVAQVLSHFRRSKK